MPPAPRSPSPPSRPRSALARALALTMAPALAAALLAGCGQGGDSRASDPAPSAAPSASASTGPAQNAAPATNPNPLDLPPVKLALAPGKRVFAVSEQMLAGAKLGSTLVLYAATVAGFDGDLLVIEGKNGPPYKIHPGYAIAVPDDARLSPGSPVITEHNGLLRHAVVKKHVKDRVFVRFIDGDVRLGETPLKAARFIEQKDGLRPGNFAAFGDGEALRHVLLVSSFDDASAAGGAPGAKKWLVLGAGGSAIIAPESALEAIPVKYQPRAGAAVLAEHNGVMRKGAVQSVTEPGIFTVKYERAGRPATLGWGFVLPAQDDGPKKKR